MSEERPSPEALCPEARSAAEEIAVLLDGHTGREDERRILEILETLAPAPFRETLSQIDLTRLLSDLDDYAFGVKHHQALLSLLAKDRVVDLGHALRVRFCRALQSGLTRTVHEAALRDVFVRTHGAELTRLKDDLDVGSGHHDLSQLLFSDIDNGDLRSEILAHFATEAPPRGAARKVLSDVDDTFYANWVDARFPKKTVYPGVRAFYQVLVRRFDGHPGGVTFLTARPADRAGVVENRTHSSLQRRGLELATTVLGGDLLHLHSHGRIAKKKIENFRRYLTLFPEYRMVFVGDSGQGDADVGRAMLDLAPEVMDGVFIHDVVTEEVSAARDPHADLVYFRTYVGAAVAACEAGLIAPTELGMVAASAHEEFASLSMTGDQGDARRRELEADLDAARTLGAEFPV